MLNKISQNRLVLGYKYNMGYINMFHFGYLVFSEEGKGHLDWNKKMLA